jgi:small subunit ribosomal protein S1
LIHLSDLSWNRPGEEAVRDFKKGDELEAIILAIDAERERISLGIKQLEGDPFSSYVAANGKGAVVKGTVTSVEAKGAVIKLGDDIEGYLRASELGRERVEDARTVLKEGDAVEAKITTIDRKNRKISLSVRAKDIEEESEAVQEYSRKTAASGGSTLGSKLKEKLDAQDTPEG